MRLRSKLILAFVLLAIVPLSGLVLYSYASSASAFRRAVEAEARQMTDQISQRTQVLQGELRDSIEDLDSLPFAELAGTGVPTRALLEELERDLGDRLRFLDGLEWTPSGDEVDTVVIEMSDDSPVGPKIVHVAPPPATGLGVEVGEAQPVPRQAPVAPLAPPEARRERLEARASELRQELLSLNEELAAREQHSAELERAAGEGRLVDTHAAIDVAVEKGQISHEIARLGRQYEKLGRMLGEDFSSQIVADGRVLGSVRARVRPQRFLGEVFSRVQPSRGEVPFVLDGEGQVYTPELSQGLDTEELGAYLAACASSEEAQQVAHVGDWLVVTEHAPDSDLVFGIARPIAEPLAEIRRASVRNFMLGIGLIGLSMLGILPLSTRMTRKLQDLSAVADRYAAGDLAVRAEAGSSDEIGQLGRAFNRMARDLEENQRRLIEQELTQRLLQQENERKSDELEEARRFQLSLLPKKLPQVPGLEVAVFMRTAAEVGGDYYDFHVESDGALTVAIGDATGHGAVAGTMVTVVKSLFASGIGEIEPRDFLQQANRAVRRMELGRMSMAFELVRFGPREGGGRRRVTFSAAGMPPATVHRAASDGTEEVAFEAMPIGSMDGSSYEQREIVLEAGDCVLLMSDGFPELISPTGEIYGYPRVHSCLRRLACGSADETVQGLVGEVEGFLAGEPPSDDVTFVVVRVA